MGSRKSCLQLYVFRAAPSEKESENLAPSVLVAGLLMVHDSVGCRENDMPELSRRQQVRRELLDPCEFHIEARRNHAALVDSAQQIDHNFAASMVINNFEFADVS